MNPPKQEQDQLSLTFMALANPTRRQILNMLKKGEFTVNELAEPFDMSLPAITKHLKVLKKAGLIQREKKAQWRPTTLDAEPLKEAMHWIEEYREFWNQALDRLEAHIDEELQREKSIEEDKRDGT